MRLEFSKNLGRDLELIVRHDPRYRTKFQIEIWRRNRKVSTLTKNEIKKLTKALKGYFNL